MERKEAKSQPTSSPLKRKAPAAEDSGFCVAMSATYKSRDDFPASDPVTMSLTLEKLRPVATEDAPTVKRPVLQRFSSSANRVPEEVKRAVRATRKRAKKQQEEQDEEGDDVSGASTASQ